MLTHAPMPRPADRLRSLVDLIEEIRLRRQAEAVDRLHPELKTFSQRELTDVACPSYKNYLLGRTTRMPKREMVMQIGDYLECTPGERDDLLICAGYLPESFMLRDDQYQAAIRRARFLLSLLPLPAVAIGRNSHTLFTNEAVFLKNEFPALDQWAAPQRNVIAYFFDPAMQVRQYYETTPDAWEKTARGAAELVYLTNNGRLRDPDFRRLIRASRELPDFARLWDDVTANPPSLYRDYGAMWMQTRYLDQPIGELSYLVPVTENLEVSIVVGVPVDEAARHVYELVGCRPESMQWESLLHDFSAGG